MTAPAVSVVMPVHNGRPFVRPSVESILAQSFGDFEFVIGDDGSTDGSGELLEALARGDPRIRLARRDRKSGVAAAFNWVVSLARAPLVAIAHADDLAHPDRLRRQVEALRARPDASAVAALSKGIDPEGRPVHPPNYWRLTQTSPFAPFVHSSLTMRRSRFERAGGYRSEADYWEDLDLYWRLLDTGPILVLPEVLMSYRHSAVSIRSREGDERVENALALMYRSTARYVAGADHGPLLRAGAAAAAKGRIHPRIFVARSWTSVWSGRRPGTLMRLLRRGDLAPNRTSLVSLGFVAAATVSPRALRLAVQAWMHGRNLVARLLLRGHPYAEWKTRRPRIKGRTAAPAPARADPEAMAPPLSVVMPVHNAGPHLDAAVASILDQSFRDFEFVILDDGSTDGSGERLRGWAARDPRIRLVEGEGRSGPVASSNRVVAESRAPLVARMDADDVARPDRLSRQLAALLDRPDAVLVGALSEAIDAGGRRVRPADYARLLRASRFAPFGHNTILFRREAFERAGGYRPEAARWEDVELYLRLAEIGRLLVVPEPLLDYRLSTGSTRLAADVALEEAMDRMYRHIEPRRAVRAGLRPRAFVPGAAIHVWNGRRPRLTPRLWRRAALGLDAESAAMLAWAAWADLSPKSLRAFQCTLLGLRNRRARRRLAGAQVVEWRPA